MDESLLKQLEAIIKKIIASYPHLHTFYIGKTEDVDRRREEHHQEGYPHTFHIAVGSADRIAAAEEYLQKLFSKNTKCDNERSGGGNPNAENLYLAVNTDVLDIEDLYDDMIVEPIKI